MHLNKVFLTRQGFDHKTQIIRHRIPETFAHDLAGVLNGKLDFQFFIPVGVDFQFSLPDPFGIILVDAGNFKMVLDIEFFQSSPD